MTAQIQIQETDNSQARRFQVDFPISKEEVYYPSSLEAQRSPLATKIFGFPWTQSVTVGPNWVDVEKQDWVEWDVLAEPLAGLMKEHFSALQGTVEENPKLVKPEEVQTNSDSGHAQLDHPDASAIIRVLDEQINPAIAAHGGKVTLVDIQDKRVMILMSGGCQGCASSQTTIREGVEVGIKTALPHIEAVVDVTDHSQGANPYYK